MKKREILLELTTADGSCKKLRIPLRLLASDEGEVLRQLRAAGVQIAPNCDHHVIAYLKQEVSRLSAK